MEHAVSVLATMMLAFLLVSGCGAGNGVELHDWFKIREAVHHEFMLDFDVRSGVQHHHMAAMGLCNSRHLPGRVQLFRRVGRGGGRRLSVRPGRAFRFSGFFRPVEVMSRADAGV